MTRAGLILGDRYRLDKRVAAGGVGQVWQATDLLLSRPVAVKVLRPEYADHPETLERFRHEAMHAGALSHPHVAQVYDYGPAGPGYPPFLVMEFVDGPSLADMLAVGPVEPAFALDVVAQAADGLSAAHRAGLVHRDVKPGNLLIGPERLVKVTDFGIAHAAGQAPVTAPNLVMGTTQYMAPERIAGGPGTPASDVYALGIVLHECLTGVPPYEGAAADVMAAHLYTPLPPLPSEVPRELEALVAGLTAKDPAQRISEARDVADLAARLRDALLAGRLAPAAAPSAVPSSAMLSSTGQVSARLAAAGPASMRPASARPAQAPSAWQEEAAENAGRSSGSVATALAVEPQQSGLAARSNPASGGAVSGSAVSGSASSRGAASGGASSSGASVTQAMPASATDEPSAADEPADAWAIPPRLSGPASPVLFPADERARRRRRAVLLTTGGVALAGVALGGLLVSGAFGASSAPNPAPGTTVSGRAQPSGGQPPRNSNSQATPSADAPGSAAAQPGVTSPQSARQRKSPSPSASARATGTASAPASASAGPSTPASGSPTSGASGAPSGSPSSSSSSSSPGGSANPTASPTATPTAKPTSSSGCLLGLCL